MQPTERKLNKRTTFKQAGTLFTPPTPTWLFAWGGKFDQLALLPLQMLSQNKVFYISGWQEKAFLFSFILFIPFHDFFIVFQSFLDWYSCFLYVFRCAGISCFQVVRHLGEPTSARSAVFMNIVQKAFDPPPPFVLNIMLQIFFDGFLKKRVNVCSTK